VFGIVHIPFLVFGMGTWSHGFRGRFTTELDRAAPGQAPGDDDSRLYLTTNVGDALETLAAMYDGEGKGALDKTSRGADVSVSALYECITLL